MDRGFILNGILLTLMVHILNRIQRLVVDVIMLSWDQLTAVLGIQIFLFVSRLNTHEICSILLEYAYFVANILVLVRLLEVDVVG